MKCGLVGPSYQQLSLPFDAQRSINLFPVLDKDGKDVSAMYGAPGLNLFATAGTGPGRGGFTASNGRAFVVSGFTLYEVLANGTTTVQGTLNQNFGQLTFDENGFQLAICDGTNLYIFTFATNAFVVVSSPNLPNAATVTFIDGYFVTNQVNSGIFQISHLYDGTMWDALDFATAESSPDNLLCVKNIVGQLWLVGSRTVEIWSDTGALAFPFAKIAGAKMETGTCAAYSVLDLDNSMFWVGQDNKGLGIVYRAEGFTPQRVSTDAIELRIQAAPTPSTLKAYAYQEAGHTFYVLTGGGMQTTLVYDLATQQWFEKAYLDSTGAYQLHLGADGFAAFNAFYVIDRTNGNIYQQSLSFYSDNGNALCRDRIFTHLFNENQRFLVRNLTVGFETGVGLESGVNPQAQLSISRDGGRTFSGGVLQSIGAVGKYLSRVIFWRLGQGRQVTFRIRVTDPVKVIISGAWFNTEGAQ